MKCRRCGATVHTDERERVEDSFDMDENDSLCFPCAATVWQEREQDAQMNDYCQDEGD